MRRTWCLDAVRLDPQPRYPRSIEEAMNWPSLKGVCAVLVVPTIEREVRKTQHRPVYVRLAPSGRGRQTSR